MLLRDRKTAQATYLENLVLPMPGHHNALNATAAITVAYQLGLSPDQIRKALAGFGGVKRRFTKTGEWNGVQIFDDYGHHPVEIAAVLRAARASTKGKVVAVMQPHRFTRLQSLFDQFATCFNDADAVIIADVYAAGEQKIEGVDRDALVAAIKAHGHRRAAGLPAPEVLPAMIREIVTPGDYVVFLGAGNITQWAYALPEQLASGGAWRVSFPDISAKIPRYRTLRGSLRANEPLAPYTWFRVGGPAQFLFMPADEDDLCLFSAEPAGRNSRHGHRARLQSHRARRRREGRRHPSVRQGLWRNRRPGRSPSERRRGGSRRQGGARGGRGRASTASRSFAAFPERSAAPCA